MFSASRVLSLHSRVLQWYRINQRSFPWRKTHAPYKILVSEIMLQQTQASRVVDFYTQWLQRFPGFVQLAKSTPGAVLRHWSGLGYNHRALRLHRLAKTVAGKYNSHLPFDIAELKKLPGIGMYTAHAVACFAFLQPVPVVDINIKRIITRISKRVHHSIELLDENTSWLLAKKLLPMKHVYEWNQALMDIGALICTSRNPLCHKCPLNKLCLSAFSASLSKKKIIKNKSEPSWKGIPRRIYRGKILKALHNGPRTLTAIASEIWDPVRASDCDWLQKVLTTMCKERLIIMLGRRYRIVS